MKNSWIIRWFDGKMLSCYCTREEAEEIAKRRNPGTGYIII